MGCKYEYGCIGSEFDGTCTIQDKLGTDEMPQDAECQKNYKEEQAYGNTSISDR